MSGTENRSGGHSATDHSGFPEEVLRKARVSDLVEVIETAETPTTREAASHADVPFGTAKKILRNEDEFGIAYAERIRGASIRHYWRVAEDNPTNS